MIKHKSNLSDEEMVQQIQENPYLQLFVGLSSFTEEQPFAPGLFIELCKRMGVDVFRDFENVLLAQLGKPIIKPEKDHFGKILIPCIKMTGKAGIIFTKTLWMGIWHSCLSCRFICWLESY